MIGLVAQAMALAVSRRDKLIEKIKAGLLADLALDVDKSQTLRSGGYFFHGRFINGKDC